MRTINLQNYTCQLLDEFGNPKEATYFVKDSLVNLLMHADLGLNGVELLKRQVFASKILTSKDPDLLIEEEEYNCLQHAIQTIRGFSRNDVELVQRIMEAKQVDVEIKRES